MQYKLRIGQELLTNWNDTVVVKAFTKDNLVVEYKGRTYEGPITAIGKSFFIKKEDLVLDNLVIAEEKNGLATTQEEVDYIDENCPKWVWDEETNNFNELNNLIKKNNKASEEIIRSNKKHIEESKFENQEESHEVAHAKETIEREEASIDNNNDFIVNPYFAHIELESTTDRVNIYLSDRTNPPVEYFGDYIVLSITGGGGLVRQIAENYYASSVKNLSYDGINYSYDLFRHITIKDSVLTKVISAFESRDGSGTETIEEAYERVTDLFLIEVLNSRKDSTEMKSIIVSIQKKQYDIISLDARDNFVVQGCAGSGKTAIMTHRLRFMRDRKARIDWDRVLIITPSTLFKSFSYNMLKSFNLDRIEQTSIEAYYWNILLQYDDYFKVREKVVIVDMSEYNSSFVEEYFSNDMFKHIIQVVKGRVDEIFSELEKYGFDVNLNEGLRNVTTQLLGPVTDYVNGWREYRKHIEEDSELKGYRETIRNYLRKQKQAQKNRDECANELSVLWQKFSLADTEEEKTKIEKDIAKQTTKLNEVKERIIDCSNIINYNTQQGKEYIANNIKNSALYSKVESIDRIDRIRIELRNIERSLFNHVLETCLNPVKEKYGYETAKSFIEIDTLTKIELFALVYIFNFSRGSEDIHKYDFICIDEGQNIDNEEYKLLRKIQNEATYNIYGDLQQKLYSNMGLKHWTLLDDFKLYELEENYRNPMGIVNYCNDNTNVRMKGFGKDASEVIKFNTNKLSNPSDLVDLDIVFELTDGKCVVLVKDKEIFDEFAKAYNGSFKLNYFSGDEIAYSTEIINVLPLSKAIGMEFPNVVVVTKELNESQRYIAFTRSLNDLIVIE